MVSFFILCMFIKAMSAQTSICVWGITAASPSSPKINGEYLYSGIYDVNNYPYYTMAVDTTCSDTGEFVLYYNAFWDQWWITKELGSVNDYEECDSPSSDNPLTTATGGCQNKWVDPNMQVTSGSCPEWDCDAITTSWPNTHDCGATFDTHIAPNVYMASSNGVYLYYNHHVGNFSCNDNHTTGCAPESVLAVSQDPWAELLKGTSIDVSFFGEGVKTLHCIGYTTSSAPTNYPTTMLPTTAMPTTHFPTTITPTTAPSTAIPTTLTPTTVLPTTNTPTYTTSMPTTAPSTATPTTPTPTTVLPTTNTPTTSMPTITNEASTHIPTRDFPNTVTPATNEEQVSDEVSTTTSFDIPSHSQSKQEPFVFVVVIICILLILISCVCITVYVFIQKQKQKNNTTTKNILNNIELAPQVNNVTNIADIDNCTSPVRMTSTVKSLSDDSDAVDNGNLSENCNVEKNIFDEGTGTDSDGEDLYQDQPNNDIMRATPQGITAGNDLLTRQ